MDNGASAPSVWSLHGTIGKLSGGRLSGEVDVARPSIGLHQPEFDHHQIPCTFLGARRGAELRAPKCGQREGETISWPLPLADAYVRGNDLVASYRPTDDWPYAPQLYWQTNAPVSVDGVLGSLSLLVSVQTHLLDTRPQISVVSQVPSNELLHISLSENGHAEVEPVDREKTSGPSGTACCVIWRLLVAPLSYVEIMPESDYHEIAFRPGSQGKLFAEWRLFADFLEKGVIRRARVQAALVPRKNDVELALECCRALELCPLPLTT